MEQIKLTKNKSMLSTNQDSYISLDLSYSNKELPHNDISKIIDVNDVYSNERNESNKYRISLTINNVMTNILTAISGEDSLSTFNTETFTSVNSPLNASLSEKSSISYKQSITNHLRIENGWVGYYKPNGLSVDCNLIELHPKKNSLYVMPKGEEPNWNIGMFFINRKQYRNSDQGLDITHVDTVDYAGRILYRFFTPFDHNLKRGDLVYLGNIGGNPNGEFIVLDLGDDDNEYKENMFVVDMGNTPSILSNTYMKKIVNGKKCSYYNRIIKKIEGFGNESFDVFQMGFASNIYGDQMTQIVLNKDLDVSELRDHMNRPLLEIIFGISKRRGYLTNLSYFTDVRSGYDLKYNPKFSTKVPDIRRINGDSNTLTTPLNTNILFLNGDEYVYDIVEYNPRTHTETILNEVKHRFNLTNRVPAFPIIGINPGGGVATNMGVRKEGYMYKPFYSIKLREESEFIEYGDSFDILPEYAYETTSNKYIWKDVLDHTYGTLNYPFLNGCHYIHKNYDLKLMRQDPFGYYGLIYTAFPSDRIGRLNPFAKDFIKENGTNDEC